MLYPKLLLIAAGTALLAGGILLFRDGGGGAPDTESRFRAWLHTPAGSYACALYSMGGALTPEAEAELSPEEVLAILADECP